jgi:hypothetical protein
MSSPSSSAGLTRQMRTRPSRPPVAMRWYDRPQDGAHATQVIAKGAGPLFSGPVAPTPVPVALFSEVDKEAGDGSSVKRM